MQLPTSIIYVLIHINKEKEYLSYLFKTGYTATIQMVLLSIHCAQCKHIKLDVQTCNNNIFFLLYLCVWFFTLAMGLHTKKKPVQDNSTEILSSLNFK